MPQLNEALVDTVVGAIVCQLLLEDITTLLDQNDDALIVYHSIAQLQ